MQKQIFPVPVEVDYTDLNQEEILLFLEKLAVNLQMELSRKTRAREPWVE